MMKAFIEKMILKMLFELKINEFYTRKSNHDGAQILAYHEVGRINFDKHIKYLKSTGHSIISMDELTMYQYSKASIPPKTIIITFDDGWKSNYSEVYPVACKYKIPVIIFIISQVYVAGLKPYFFVKAELNSSGIKNIPDEVSWACWDNNARKKVVHKLITGYKDCINRSHSLSIEEIRDMLNSGFVSFGSHTSTHPNLNNIAVEEVKKEICESKTDIELLLNQSIDHFAYPIGYYSRKHFDILRDAGYKTAVTIIPGWNNFKNGTHPFELKRVFLSAADDVAMFAAKLSGLWHKIHRKRLYYS